MTRIGPPTDIVERAGQRLVGDIGADRDPRAGELDAEMALHRAEHHDVVEIRPLHARADRGRKIEGGEPGRHVLADQRRAQAMQRLVAGEPERARSRRRSAPCGSCGSPACGPWSRRRSQAKLWKPKARFARLARRRDDSGLGRPLADQPVILEIAQCLAYRDQADAEALGEIGLARQRRAGRRPPPVRSARAAGRPTGGRAGRRRARAGAARTGRAPPPRRSSAVGAGLPFPSISSALNDVRPSNCRSAQPSGICRRGNQQRPIAHGAIRPNPSIIVS